MDSFKIELVSNASGELFPNNTLSSFTNFLPEQVNLEGQWELAISEIFYPSMYKNITEGKFKFFHEKLSKSTTTYNLETGLNSSITDIVEAVNTLIQERNNHNETCMIFSCKISRKTQKVVIMLANDTSSLAFCRTDLGHVFGNNVGKGFDVLMIGKVPLEPEFVSDILRMHSLMIYSNLVRYKIDGDTKDPLVRCFPFTSKLKGGDIITVHEQYMNIRHSVTNSLDLCSKNLFVVYTSIWETHLVKKYPSFLSVSLG